MADSVSAKAAPAVRLSADLLRPILEANASSLRGAGSRDAFAKQQRVARAQRLVCRQFEDAAMDVVWRTMPFMIGDEADLAWIEAMPDRVAARLENVILACNEPLERCASVVIAALRRMPALKRVSFGPAHEKPMLDLPILDFFAGSDAPRLKSFELTAPDSDNDGKDVPAEARIPFWRSLARMLRAQTELDTFQWVCVNGEGVPDEAVVEVMEALASLPRLEVIDT